MRQYVDYVRDMLDAVEKALRFVEGMDHAAFVADEKTVFATIRALEIIGEASKKVPKPVRDRYHDVPWRAMAGIRDRLIHDYFGADTDVVWQTLQEDLPKLRPPLEAMLAEARSSKADEEG